VPSASSGVRRLAGEQCDITIALIRLSLGGMLVKKYLIPTLNSGVKFHVTKQLD
jgi:hypothetical protein